MADGALRRRVEHRRRHALLVLAQCIGFQPLHLEALPTMAAATYAHDRVLLLALDLLAAVELLRGREGERRCGEE